MTRSKTKFGPPRLAHFLEQATWGTCPRCKARNGEACRITEEEARSVKIPADSITHRERTDAAPQLVRLQALTPKKRP